MCVTGPDFHCCCFTEHSDCSWPRLADFGEVLTCVEQSWGGGGAFIPICHGLGVFIPLKGDILMSLFLLKNLFCGAPNVLPFPCIRMTKRRPNNFDLLCCAGLGDGFTSRCFSNLMQKLSWHYFVPNFLVCLVGFFQLFANNLPRVDLAPGSFTGSLQLCLHVVPT